MIAKFQEIYGAENAKTVDLGSPHLLLDSVMDSVSSTILHTMSQTMDGFKLLSDFKTGTYLGDIQESHESSASQDRSLKDYSITENTPWGAEFHEEQSCQWLVCKLVVPSSPKYIKDHLETITHVWSQAKACRAKDPFAEGAQRLSYHGQ